MCSNVDGYFTFLFQSCTGHFGPVSHVLSGFQVTMISYVYRPNHHGTAFNADA